MDKYVIESFQEFLNSNSVFLNEKEGGTQSDAIAMVSAYTSSSNIKPDLAKGLGIGLNKSYTFTANFLDLLYSIGSTKKFDSKILGEGVAVKSGEDVLKINDKTITEKGEFYIDKKEGLGNVKITVSGNGFLCLARMGAALVDMFSKRNISFRSGQSYSGTKRECKDWVMKFSLGGVVKSEDSRGYNYYYAYPGSLSEHASSNALTIAIASLEFTGNDSLIARKNPQISSKFDSVVNAHYNNYVKGKKNIGESLQKEVESSAKSLLDKNILVTASPKLNTSEADAFVKNASSYFISSGNPSEMVRGKSMIALNAKGITAARSVLSSMAECLVPAKPENWGPEGEKIFKLYQEAIKTGLESADVQNWFRTAQKITNWTDAPSTPGLIGAGDVKQGEGKY